MTQIGGQTPTYDSNGNVTNDFLHTFSWDSDGRAITISGIGVTYDAFGRMVERNNSGSYSQIVYAPSGGKLAVMTGQSLVFASIPLTDGSIAEYWNGGTLYYRHPDWLGSSRLVSTSTRSMRSDTAYSPFGVPYNSSGVSDVSFTGINQDTTSNLYDFPAREYGIQGRWPSPDPAGLMATDSTNPQSWNRYAYVLNNPLRYTDPFGLWHCDWGNGDYDDTPENGGVTEQQCKDQGGARWVNDAGDLDGIDAGAVAFDLHGARGNTVPTSPDGSFEPGSLAYGVFVSNSHIWNGADSMVKVGTAYTAAGLGVVATAPTAITAIAPKLLYGIGYAQGAAASGS
jgi:RHS repeat-associated protein